VTAGEVAKNSVKKAGGKLQDAAEKAAEGSGRAARSGGWVVKDAG
jgi:hypothetical protein